jgi:hypothetical protein
VLDSGVPFGDVGTTPRPRFRITDPRALPFGRPTPLWLTAWASIESQHRRLPGTYQEQQRLAKPLAREGAESLEQRNASESACRARSLAQCMRGIAAKPRRVPRQIVPDSTLRLWVMVKVGRTAIRCAAYWRVTLCVAGSTPRHRGRGFRCRSLPRRLVFASSVMRGGAHHASCPAPLNKSISRSRNQRGNFLGQSHIVNRCKNFPRPLVADCALKRTPGNTTV